MASKAKRKISKQVTFNRIVRGLLKQGKRALNGTQCAYKADDGSKCAAGQLIPSNLYRKSLEGLAAVATAPARIIVNLGHDLRLVSLCQRAHDNDAGNTRFSSVIDRLIYIAENEGLDIPKELRL